MATENKANPNPNTTKNKKRKQRYLPHNVLSLSKSLYSFFFSSFFQFVISFFFGVIVFLRNQWRKRVDTHYTQECKASSSLAMVAGNAKLLVKPSMLLIPYALHSLLFLLCLVPRKCFLFIFFISDVFGPWESEVNSTQLSVMQLFWRPYKMKICYSDFNFLFLFPVFSEKQNINKFLHETLW